MGDSESPAFSCNRARPASRRVGDAMKGKRSVEAARLSNEPDVTVGIREREIALAPRLIDELAHRHSQLREPRMLGGGVLDIERDGHASAVDALLGAALVDVQHEI